MRADGVTGDAEGVDRLDDVVRERLLEVRRGPRTRGALRELGLGEADIRRLLRNGHLQHHHGTYLDAAVEEELARIACAHAAYPGSVVSHFSAARLAGLQTWTDSRRPASPPQQAVWLTRPPVAKRNQRRQDIVVRRAGLTTADLSRLHGLPITSVARTVVDLARELSLREAIVTVDHALRFGTTTDELRTVLDRQHRWPGIARARTAIDFADPGAESALESIARVVFAAAGLPAPVLQVQFFDGYAWMLERVDFWWPDFRTVAEADGLAKYEADSAEERRRLMRRSHRRDQRLGDRGIELVHFGWEDAVDPRSDLVARLRAAFRRGQTRSGEPPTWRTTPTQDAA